MGLVDGSPCCSTGSLFTIMDHFLGVLSLQLLAWTPIMLCCTNIKDKSKPQAYEISFSEWFYCMYVINLVQCQRETHFNSLVLLREWKCIESWFTAAWFANECKFQLVDYDFIVSLFFFNITLTGLQWESHTPQPPTSFLLSLSLVLSSNQPSGSVCVCVL